MEKKVFRDRACVVLLSQSESAGSDSESAREQMELGLGVVKMRVVEWRCCGSPRVGELPSVAYNFAL